MEAPTSATNAEAAEDLDSTIHGFNETNVTVIEKHAPGDGSDSGVEDSFDLLARKNSGSMLQDLKDSGSETSSTSSRPSTSSKKKVSVQTPSKTQTNSKPPPKKPTTPRPSTLKTALAATSKPKPQEKPSEKNRPKPSRSTSSTRTPRTPVITPTDDGRWPSNNKNTMSRSLRGNLPTTEINAGKNKNILDKYGTLPRRRREKSADNIREPSLNRTANLRRQVSRESTPARSLPPYPKKKTRIFAETSAQTALTLRDINRLIDSGTLLERGERTEKQIQTEKREDEAVVALKKELKVLQLELAAEKTEKQALQAELERNMQRVQTILDNTTCKEQTQKEIAEEGDDSILELETRFQTAGQIIIKQENEISELHAFCRTLQRELEVSILTRRQLESAQQELESESRELQEFLAAEKWALCEALAEAEARGTAVAAERARLRHDALTLEARSRDLLLAQGAAVSGAAVALSGLAHRLDTLTGRLATAYNISEQQLDDDIYHNEAYNPDTPDSPQINTTSFLNAVISAIKNTVTENVEPEETLLDSETEPCLMMENVLEDVIHIDTHTHNLVSEPGASASSLVDQVIEADNLLTRLLKILRVIQKIQDGDAAALKSDLQQHRVHVERLSHDVCALSTACSTQRSDEMVESMAQRLQEANKAVDNALEILQACGELISENPNLSELRDKLKIAITFCRSPTSLGSTSDQNANASVVSCS